MFVLYPLRRVRCLSWGIKMERAPWCQGESHLTTSYAWFLARWTKRLSWKEVSAVFQTSWDSVVRSVKMAVSFGLEHRSLDGVTQPSGSTTSPGVGGQQKYATLAYQLDGVAKRLMWVARERTERTLRRFFESFGEERCQPLRFVCSDMRKPYLHGIAQKAGRAVHVLNRLHIMTQLSKAIDEVRAKEVNAIKVQGKNPVLTKARWRVLKRLENLTENHKVKLLELLACNLRTVRAYLLEELSKCRQVCSF